MNKNIELLKEAMNLYPSHSEMYEHSDYLIVEGVSKVTKINHEEYGVLSQAEKPTKKQLNFIKVIEEEWKQNPFTGATKKEAREYISEAVKEKERYDFESEAMGYGLPNQ